MHSLHRNIRVLLVFARNSLVRAMMFRVNFLIECVSSLAWVLMNLGFYSLMFTFTPSIGANTGWTKYPYFVFLATLQFIYSLAETFFMPNAEEFSELIRNGDLDFALVKPIDTQVLVSFAKCDWSGLSNFIFAGCLLAYALVRLDYTPGVAQIVLYPLFIFASVAILYSLTVVLASTSVWFGRNQSIYDFWFYITNFSRYPLEIYSGPFGTPLQWTFTFIIPVLVVVNVPARLLARPLTAGDWRLAGFALLAAVASLVAARWVFQRAIRSYRSASS
jgi:ABC-2 type transport system permease protein